MTQSPNSLVIGAWVLVIIWLLGFGAWIFPHAVALAEEREASLQVGKALYEQHCARCHGVDGRGSGPDAKRIFPKPRDLTQGVYKFRSTGSGTPPTDEDLFRVIYRGLPGSAMPAFDELPEAERRQLVAYIKSLSPTIGEQQPQPVVLTQDPGVAAADLVKGKQLYKDLGCAACHGTSGRGNGPSAKGLVDDLGNPIRAANLTQGWTYRGGSDPRSIALRVLTGIDGTPMPSYAEATSFEDAWHLAYYVRSLQEEPHWNAVVNVLAVAGQSPASLADPVWSSVERTDVSLGSTVYSQGALVPTTVNVVSIQAVYNGEAIALRLVWDDPTEDRSSPADALGLALKPDGLGDIGSLDTWPLAGSSALDVIFWSADTNQVREGVVVGFAPVATGEIPVEILPGEAVYEDGRWTLLIRRPLKAEGAIALSVDQSVPVAIAIWDGDNNEQRKVRSSSAWLDLVLRNFPKENF